MKETKLLPKTYVTIILATIVYLFAFHAAAAASVTYTVRMSDVDDIAILYINGAPLYKAKWGYTGVEPTWYYHGHSQGDSGEVDITSDLVPGENHLRFTLEDTACCGTSLTIAVRRNEEVIFTDSYNQYQGSGIWYDETIIVDTGATGPPVLVSPANSSTVSDHTITFDWLDVFGISSYEIIVDNDQTFASPEVHEPGIHVKDLTESQYDVTNWFPNRPYYWKVIAHFSDGSQVESEIWAFTYSLGDQLEPVWIPLYRFYIGEEQKDHFYTTITDQGERAVNDGYTFERIECYISDRKFADGTPLMRLYNPTINSHFYTVDEIEKDAKISAHGYQYEGIQGWAFSSNQTGGVPLHRLKQTKQTDFHYFLCARQTEYDQVLVNPFWAFQDDGDAGYVYPAGLREPEAHRKPQGRYGGVDMATRAFRMTHPSYDLALRGVGLDMFFRHYYNSFNYFRVPMGPGWSHSFFGYIMEDRDHTFVIVKWGDGTETYFTKEDQQEYIPEPGSYATLSRVEDGLNEGYDVRTKDQTLYQFRKLSVYAPQSPIPGIYLISVKDRNGNTLSLSWQASHGLLLSVTDASGHKFEFSYEDNNHPLLLTKVTETALNRSVSFAYDEAGRLVTFIDARGQNTTYEYDDNDRLTKITRPKLNYYTIEYDTDGTVNSVTDGTNPPANILPVTGGTQVTTPKGNTLKFESANYVLTKLIDGRLKPTQFEYGDDRHPTLPTKVTDRLGHDTHYTYDERGNVTKITNHLGREADFSYDLQNNLESRTDFHLAGQTGNVTGFEYDANGNLTDINNPEEKNTHFTHDSRGLVLTARDGRGKITHYAYDANGNLRQITDPEGNVAQYHPDAAGRLLWKKDAESTYTYYDYDASDNLMKVRDHSNFTVSFDYDSNNNIERVRWTRNGTASSTVYSYDTMDRLKSVQNPLSFTTTYSYNQDNTLKSKTDPKIQIVNYDYDENALLASIQYPNDTRRTITRYDNGLLNAISSPNGTTTFEYTELGQIKKVTDPYNKIVEYIYDVRNNLAKIIYPGGKEVIYGYDSLNRLVYVEDWISGITTYEYDTSGNLTRIVRPNNTEAIYSYDDASRLVGVTEQKTDLTPICTYTYVLDRTGNYKSVAANEALPGTVWPKEASYTHDEANRLLTAGSVSYTYDNNGNRKTSTSAGGTTYAWDYENMLTQIQTTSPAKTVQHHYDGLNNRLALVDGGNTTRYVLDLSGEMSRVLAETDASGNIIAYYVYGLGLLSRILPDDTRHFYHCNNRGDTIALTDDQGNITDKYAYDEYGNLLNSEGTTAHPFKFIGRYGVMDEGDGLYFMRARFYDAEVGRFLSEDPLGFGGGDWNLYAYVGGNPVKGIDPMGLFWDEIRWKIRRKLGLNPEGTSWEEFKLRMGKEYNEFALSAKRSMCITPPEETPIGPGINNCTLMEPFIENFGGNVKQLYIDLRQRQFRKILKDVLLSIVAPGVSKLKWFVPPEK